MLTIDLIKYLRQKYSLTFKQMLANNRNIFVLMPPNSDDFFAILSRVPNQQIGVSGEGHAVTLDLKCGDFSQTLVDLPGFTKSFRIKSNNWVGLWLNQVNDDEVKKTVDYAYKLALNGEIKTTGQYLLIPEEEKSSASEIYHAERIPPRTPRKTSELNKGKDRINDIPPEIEKMLQSYDYTILPALGRQKNFYYQGQLMAAYEDNYEQNYVFNRFYPTYHDMTVHQLRTYFTWRTKVRKGVYNATSRSYVFIYIYELLNQIGIKQPEEGYKLLTDLYNNYVIQFDPEIASYLKRWIKDYVVFYNLRDYKSKVLSTEIEEDKLIKELLTPKNSTELIANLEKVSTYHGKSLLDKDKYQDLIFFVWNKLLAHKKYFDFAREVLFVTTTREYYFFSRALLYKRKPKFEVFSITENRKFYQKDGRIYYQYLSPVMRQKTKLNAVLHEIDRLSRLEYQIGRKLKANTLNPAMVLVIEQAVKDFHQAEIDAKRPKIKINFEHLNKIRSDASETRESLLTQEEKELERQAKNELETEEKQEKVGEKEQTGEGITSKALPYNLTVDEYFFLMSLWHQTSWKENLQQKHLMPSILADAINEKLFDEIGDSIIEFDGEEPQIISDYLPDLADLFSEE